MREPGSILTGLAPIADGQARVLILGSMPSPRSLAQQAYYAHPRNAFWPILAEICGFDSSLPYPERCAALRRHRIALWDVLQHCTREGAADSTIANETANDFAGFYAQHPAIRQVFFNGSAAEALYRRLLLPTLADRPLVYQRLPSTSPAYAAMSREQKCRQWRALLPAAITDRCDGKQAPGRA
jgi:hypoxanthine-DNA glycosylase